MRAGSSACRRTQVDVQRPVSVRSSIVTKSGSEITALKESEHTIHVEGIRSFYVATAVYLLKDLPLDNKLLKALSCLHPHNRQTAGRRQIETLAN